MPKKAKTAPSKRHQKSKFSELNNGEFVMGRMPDSGAIFFQSSSQTLVSNYNFIDAAKGIKYFIMDNSDIAMSNADIEPNTEALHSLTEFMKKLDYKKKIYIRQMPTVTDFRYLVDDVLEIIPLVLRQQGNPIVDTDARLENLREEWAIPIEDVANGTITEEELKQALETFDVNKSLITVVPDFEYLTRKEHHFQTMRGFVNYVNHNGDEVMFSTQVIYHLFMECIVGYNWTVSSCELNWNCRRKAMQLVKKIMFNSMIFENNQQVKMANEMSEIQKIKSQCFFVHQKEAKDTDHLFLSYKPNDPAPNQELKRIANKYKILQTFIPKLAGGSKYPVWQARIILLAGWIDSFYYEEADAFAKTMLIDIVCSVLPSPYVEPAKHLMNELAFDSPPAPQPTSDDYDDDDDNVDDEEESECNSDNSDFYDVDPEVFSFMLNQRAPKSKEEVEKLMKNRSFRQEVKKNKGIAVKPRPMRPPPRNVKKSEKKKENDGWKDYSEERLQIFRDTVAKENYIEINGELYGSNYSRHATILPIEHPAKRRFYFNISKYGPIFYRPFLIDEYPLLNLETYSKFADDFAVRSMETTKGCYILTNDILELIPILLKKQEAFSIDVDKKLKLYQKNWDSGNPEVLNSVEVSFFKIICDSLKVNRDLLTIIPDVSHLESMDSVVENGYISTEYGAKQKITCKEQAIWHIFQSVVCGVNWATKSCKKNKAIVDGFKEKYFEETGKLMKMRKGTFVTAKYLEATISTLHSHQVFTDKIAHRVADYNFDKLGYCNHVSIEDYEKNCELFGLPKYDCMYRERRSYNVPAYLARSRNHLGWLNTFYPPVMLEEKEVLIDEMLYGFPKSQREIGWEFLMKNIGCAVTSSAKLKESDEMTNLMKLIENPSILKKMQTATSSVESKKPSEKPKKSKEPKKKEEPTPSLAAPQSSKPLSITPQKPKKAPTKPKLCTKCTENGVALLNAREQLKKAEFSAKHNETKARKTEKVDAKLEKMKLNMKELEREIGDLNEELKDFDGQEDQIRKENKEILKDIGKLGEQVESEKMKNEEAYRRNKKIKMMFDVVQTQLATRESQRVMMEEKRRKNPASSTSSEGPSTFHVPFVPSLPTTEDPELAEDPKWVLEQWRMMKTNFERDEMVQEEREMIEELLSNSEDLDLDVRNLVEYEQHQFEATCRIYLKNIDLNILKIEKTEDISNLRPLAKYPSLSTEFQIEYEKIMGSN
ncbi:hypothetical protein CAEBREN_03598 [Caenorhabditis brenneri]|uniref:Uncharacterized protein n=1 Tax=Caenorhabditis brenneri TaxID=135651 RepID=G0MWX3_CAEBE|nr:hypothetical protein CAEBREN_03598 [Caenorhabditis brenneri]